jgi:hypothetical protein
VKAKPKLLVLCAVLTFSFSGCSTAPSIKELSTADYGAFPADYKELVQNYMNGVLKDPESARYEYLKGPTPIWTAGLMRKKQFGYGVCVHINAKNSFGGYTGRSLFFFLIYNGSIVRTVGGSDQFDEAEAEKLCKDW